MSKPRNRMYFTLSETAKPQINWMRLPRWYDHLRYWLTYPFYWRRRRQQREELARLKAEMAKAAAVTISAALGSFAKAIALLESLPVPPIRRVRYRSEGFRPRLTAPPHTHIH